MAFGSQGGVRAHLREEAIAGRIHLASTRTRETISEAEKTILEQWAVQYFQAPPRHAMRDDAVRRCLVALLEACTDDARRNYWTRRTVRQWFTNSVHSDVPAPGNDPASKARLRLELERSITREKVATRAERSAQRRAAVLAQELAQANEEVERLNAQHAADDQFCDEVLESMAELLEQVDEAQQLLEQILADPDRGMPDVPEDERPVTCAILREVMGQIEVQPCRRRFSDEVYKLAFTLLKHSRAGCEVLRRVGLPLPSRMAIQDHFREAMDEEEDQLTANPTAEAIATRVFKHCRAHGVEDPSGLPVIVTSDATGMSDTGG
jgi:hypothetical protein